MFSRIHPWVLAGVALDIIGLVLIATSLPEGGVWLAAGTACFALGTLAVLYAPRKDEGEAPPRDVIRKARRQWRAEPELLRDPPRRVRLAPAARISLLAWALAFAMVGFFAWERVVRLNPPSPGQALLGEEGLTGDATIHRKETRETADGEPRYYLYYHFESAAGAAVRSSATVGRALFDQYETGDALEVRYLPSDPILHYLPKIERTNFALRAVLMALVVAVFFLFLLEAKRRRHRKLVKEGRAAPGVVETLRRRGGSRAVTVRFEARQTEQTLSATLRHVRVEVGEAVTVLYDPTDPREAELYRACLYRAEYAE